MQLEASPSSMPTPASLYERERDYEIAHALVISLRQKGLLSESELKRIDAILAEKFSAVVGQIRCKTT